MIREIFPVGLLQCNCSVFADSTTREAVVIDPGDGLDDMAHLQSVLARHNLKVSAIVITHAHIDHIGAAAKLKKSTGAPVYMNPADQDLYSNLDWQANWLGMKSPETTEIDAPARDGDTLKIGSTDLHLIHTPGHTQGSLCVYAQSENILAAGDTLFRDSIGRTDLPGGDPRQILRSIHNRLLTLPPETEVICGHGPSTTIGRERERNPFLQT
ncbi:MAG: MBL fold metallo-hydrolase [Candidatus Solibacter sp.]|nr:MBL fold metallo-hydrolase [Candidatus Solibacter sp.]